ncbi:MAG: hypothetical protein H0U95_11825 [Bacteroidetes bacterium]|nr:hypothetical protein [Bacteroidota bacterium]
MKAFLILIAGLLIFLLSNCSDPSKEEIKTVVNTFFKSRKDFRDIDKNLMTTSLSSLIEKTVAIEIADGERIKKSEYPTDKPMCIEGDIFSSLYEGQDSLKIIDIKTEDNKATVTIELTNTLFKQSWEDKVILIKDSTWKIDNVIFKAGNMETKSTKDVLTRFINSIDKQ